MTDELKINLYSLTLDCPDLYLLAQFYAKLLHWEIVFHDDTWACVAPPGIAQGTYPGIMFQKNLAYQSPIWPDQDNCQQQMAHLDFSVNDLEQAVLHALNCGATKAKEQFSSDWTVMLDPVGHPFCLCQLNL